MGGDVVGHNAGDHLGEVGEALGVGGDGEADCGGGGSGGGGGIVHLTAFVEAVVFLGFADLDRGLLATDAGSVEGWGRLKVLLALGILWVRTRCLQGSAGFHSVWAGYVRFRDGQVDMHSIVWNRHHC